MKQWGRPPGLPSAGWEACATSNYFAFFCFC